MEKKENYMISIDWLQLSCERKKELTKSPSETISIGKYSFSIILKKDETAMFKQVYTVKNNGLEIATIQCSPRSSKLDKNLVLVKIANRVLYSHEIMEISYALTSALELKINGLTRLDLAFDCQYFAGGRNPSRFINNFIAQSDISRENIRKKGSEEFTCHGKKPTGGRAKINYIRFGSPKSKVSAYIYNKSLELREVKDKPWIREAWIQNGLDETKKDIFRSEISISSQGMDMLSMKDGQLFRLGTSHLETQLQIEKIFYVYARKYFDFRIDEGQKLKKNFKHIWLFPTHSPISFKPYTVSRCADTGRTEKMASNLLERILSTYSDITSSRTKAVSDTINMLNEIKGVKCAITRQNEYKLYLHRLKAYKFECYEYDLLLKRLRENEDLLRKMEDCLDIPHELAENHTVLPERSESELQALFEYDYPQEKI